MKSMLESTNVIETLVKDRRVGEAKVQIRDWLKTHGKGAGQLQGCDWYRRLGLFQEGLRLLDLKSLRDGGPSSLNQKKRLWLARFLNSMGAGSFAAQLVRALELRDGEDLRVAGNILLTNFDTDQARLRFEEFFARRPDLREYQTRLTRISLADCYSAMGDTGRALKAVLAVEQNSQEPLLRAIALQAAGEYLARAGENRKAVRYLLQAERCLPHGEHMVDRAVLEKWKGFVLSSLGEREMGNLLLEKSMRRLRQLKTRPEAWLDCWRLQIEAKLRPESDRKKLYWYPGVSEGFRTQVGATPEWSEPGTAIWIDFMTEEAKVGQKRILGLSSEWRLAAWVAATGSEGLSRLTAKSLLWPEEVYSFFELDARLDQLQMRLRRKWGIDIRQVDGFLYSPKSGAGFRFGPSSMPSFLVERGEFSSAAVAEWYDISKAQLAVYLRRWIDQGWISRKGGGKELRYSRATLNSRY